MRNGRIAYTIKNVISHSVCRVIFLSLGSGDAFYYYEKGNKLLFLI